MRSRALLKRRREAGSEAVSDGRGSGGSGGHGGTGESSGGYGRGARLLSVGIASTGVVTFAYFSVASYVLSDLDYQQISLLWSVIFVVASVIYRPIEQLLSRTIADRRARGLHTGHPLRTPLLLQGGFALVFVGGALAGREVIVRDALDGGDPLFWVLVAAVVCYAASYFARGWLAGHQWFGLYGGLVFMEAVTRLLFAVAVAIGIASGQLAVALGMAAAPLISLVVVPLAFRRLRRPPAVAAPPHPSGRLKAHSARQDNTNVPLDTVKGAGGAEEGSGRAGKPASEEDLALARGGRFALAVVAIMLAEQTLINAPVLTASATASDAAVAGYIFNALLIARAPLQLFQAVQGSLLPHLTGLQAGADGDAEFRRAIRVTILAIVAFAGAVTLGLLLVGPWAMDLLFDLDVDYARGGLALVGVGMGAHLIAGTLNQAALARDRAPRAAACWLASAAVYVAWLLSPVVEDQLLRAQIGYPGAALLLCALLVATDRRRR